MSDDANIRLLAFRRWHMSVAEKRVKERNVSESCVFLDRGDGRCKFCKATRAQHPLNQLDDQLALEA